MAFGVCFLISLSLMTPVGAYRVGDIVDTEVFQGGGRMESTLRAHMPNFGVDSSLLLPLEEDDGHLSLVFGHGLLPTSNMAIQNRQGQSISNVKIEFTYSGGSGDIHSVSSRASYAAHAADHVVVEYEWKKQSSIQLELGLAVMLLSVLVVSVIFIFQLCAFVDEQDRQAAASQQKQQQQEQPTGQYVQKRW